MSSFDKMLGWFLHTRRGRIALILAIIILWLLIVVIFELELRSTPDDWRLN
jgi:cytochrome c oxidase subunit IV